MDHHSFVSIAFLLMLALHFSLALTNFDESTDSIKNELDPSERIYLQSINGKDNNMHEKSEWRRQSDPTSPQSSSPYGTNKGKIRARLLKYDFLRNQWVMRKIRD
ncbi:unnamed protein product [Rotaria magnacalcarata]|uniref:Uncharacterized protein n=2 Tax=Rotaria magnacalcarata TaxID=392030 RepID=A0A816Y0Z7_9BILA|nr:unnamed protein product [Rotaria magnacalcarata]